MDDKKTSIEVSEKQLVRLRTVQFNYFIELVSKIPGTDPTADGVDFSSFTTDDESLIYSLIEREIDRTEAELEKLLVAKRPSVVGDFLK